MNRRDLLDPRRLAQAAGEILAVVEDAAVAVEQPAEEMTLLRFGRRAMATDFEIALPFGTPDAVGAGEDALDLINRLSNKDRHQRLPVITWGLGDVRSSVVLKGSGQIVPTKIAGPGPAHRGFKNNASIPIPDGVVYVKLRGTPVVLIRIGEERSNFRIPGVFWEMLNWLRTEAFPRLEPYSRRGT